ncbi:methyl-accepting chemotaxis sensory transducer [Gottschalkia acidurici 9a]|uniref:Methyl-accepting chemotaxis sensory transducer n=1 Tax=Gottschalkia acidurici (strain ATCC 7906 / DSM 604 / BCRC 14475 / CIP 104303 / KCTC 5404 / NCIMB 10678 / 9a) TaxID=1128398 RepID=K0B3R4_GOTA9|nr:methyl-accepting chemotaxis protein [Gottschalkia acidurici]AFS79525.1 methyl-accepting chemotaxis sensory transducer [Gottschalkia acidurici 9a]
MFFRKNKVQEEIGASAQMTEIDKSNNDLKSENEFLKSSIKETYDKLIEILHNHSLVNEQHQELANLAGEIKDTIEKVKSISNETSSLSEYLSERSEKLTMISTNSVSKSIDGEEAVNNLMGVMSSLQSQSQDSSNTMISLGERSKEITDIIKTITDIASQTNLLALNAAIEAARAGEHGRGFAIVADEVRKLAEITTQSTTTIQELVVNIQNEIDIASSNNDKSNKAIEEGILMSRVVTEKIKDIVQDFESVQKEVEEVTNAINRQKNYINDILAQAELSDEILINMNDNLISHVERAAVVDEKLEENLSDVKDLIHKNKVM